jgi:hypothetical protein
MYEKRGEKQTRSLKSMKTPSHAWMVDDVRPLIIMSYMSHSSRVRRSIRLLQYQPKGRARGTGQVHASQLRLGDGDSRYQGMTDALR